MKMWLSEIDATSYVLLISVLIILTIFALLIFGSLPCTCKYIFVFTNYLCCRKTSRVADSSLNRVYVIGGGVPDAQSPTQFPRHPFATLTQVHGRRPMTLVSVTESIGPHLPCYHHQVKFPLEISAAWDDAPPTYDTLFPQSPATSTTHSCSKTSTSFNIERIN